MSKLRNAIVVTWPKKRPLESYLEELAAASRRDEFIHYRVPSFPMIPFGARCYMVHDGAIRGWLTTLGFSDGSGVIDPITGRSWPEGRYIVRNPRWHPIDPLPMEGFRGWRYYDLDL